MIWQVLLAALFTMGPVLDPIAGEHVGVAERKILPAARHLGSIADLWFVQVVNMQNSGAGIGYQLAAPKR